MVSLFSWAPIFGGIISGFHTCMAWSVEVFFALSTFSVRMLPNVPNIIITISYIDADLLSLLTQPHYIPSISGLIPNTSNFVTGSNC